MDDIGGRMAIALKVKQLTKVIVKLLTKVDIYETALTEITNRKDYGSWHVAKKALREAKDVKPPS